MLGSAQRNLAERGQTGQGKAIAILKVIMWLPGQGEAGLGMARYGMAQQALAKQGKSRHLTFLP